MMTIKLKSLCIALIATIISLTNLAKATVMTLAKAEEQIAEAGVGICLQTINHQPLNSFKHLKDKDKFKEACPNLEFLIKHKKYLSDFYGESDIENLRDSKVKTQHNQIDRCLKKDPPRHY